MDEEVVIDVGDGEESCMEMVEICFGAVDCIEELRKAANKLNIPLTESDAAWEELLTDLKTISCQTKKEEMLKIYANMLAKRYEDGRHSEMSIKRILVLVGPAIIKQSLAPIGGEVKTPEPESISDDDISVIEYLSGRLLRWGLKAIPGEGNDWCRAQIAHGQFFAETIFNDQNRGGLIVPVKLFTSIIVRAEYHFRRHANSKIIDERSVLKDIDMSFFYPANEHSFLAILIKRFVRTRAHIHCKLLGRQKASCKTSNSLRSVLKSGMA